MSSENIYYVYILIDPRVDQPFYIGKGKENRVASHYYNWASLDKTNKCKVDTINELKHLGFIPTYYKLTENLTEREALDYEELLIREYGRIGVDQNGILTNVAVRGMFGGKGKPVCQYNLFGEKIQTFPSAKIAAEKLKISAPSAITQCCKKTGTSKQSGGYFWSYEGAELDVEWCFDKKHPVFQWTLEGEFVARYINAKEAIHTLNLYTYQSAIYNCLHGGKGFKHQCKQAAGFIWTYADSPPTPYSSTTKRVLCTTTGLSFSTVGEAARFYKLDRSAISRVCTGEHNHTHNLHFQYS